MASKTLLGGCRWKVGLSMKEVGREEMVKYVALNYLLARLASMHSRRSMKEKILVN